MNIHIMQISLFMFIFEVKLIKMEMSTIELVERALR